jgi:hypothetical protein
MLWQLQFARSHSLLAGTEQSQASMAHTPVFLPLQVHPLTRSFSQGSRNTPTQQPSGERVLSPQNSSNSHSNSGVLEEAAVEQPQTPRDLRVGECGRPNYTCMSSAGCCACSVGRPCVRMPVCITQQCIPPPAVEKCACYDRASCGHTLHAVLWCYRRVAVPAHQQAAGAVQ